MAIVSDAFRSRLSRFEKRMNKYISKHPFMLCFVFGTATISMVEGITNYPTASKVEAYNKRVQAVSAYTEALPKKGDTIESVIGRMDEIEQKYGSYAVPRFRNSEMDCKRKIPVAFNKANFSGNTITATVDPQPYFSCLKEFAPRAGRSPTEEFRDMTLIVAPLAGLVLGAVVGFSEYRRKNASRYTLP